MADQSQIRQALLSQFNNEQAHIGLDKAVDGLKIDEAGIRPDKLPHSIWELVEHIRISQYDILNFCRNADYEALSWPDDYWPSSVKPGNKQEWGKSLQTIKEDHRAMADIIGDPERNLLQPLEHGDGQTLFREAVLIIDHTSYHIAQIVQVRRLLDIWN